MQKPRMCDPALLQKDLSGKNVVITGANSGIGLLTAKQLAKQGAHVVLACRRTEAGQEGAREIRQGSPGASVEVARLDLGDLSSVRAFAEELLAKHEKVDILINNAGVMNTPQQRTKDGFEMQFGVNHLGHFLLTELLTPALERAAPSRIVTISSSAHDIAQGRLGKIDLDDLHFESRKYDGWVAYAQSKLANVLHAKGLAKRLEGKGITVVSVHPGWVRTPLIKHTMPLFAQNYLLRPVLRLMGQIEPWPGVQTSLHAALADDLVPGAFYAQIGTFRDKSANKGGWPLESPNPQAHDPALVDALWAKSEALVGLA